MHCVLGYVVHGIPSWTVFPDLHFFSAPFPVFSKSLPILQCPMQQLIMEVLVCVPQPPCYTQPQTHTSPMSSSPNTQLLSFFLPSSLVKNVPSVIKPFSLSALTAILSFCPDGGSARVVMVTSQQGSPQVLRGASGKCVYVCVYARP